jgi:hypothetical protein
MSESVAVLAPLQLLLTLFSLLQQSVLLIGLFQREFIRLSILLSRAVAVEATILAEAEVAVDLELVQDMVLLPVHQ